MSSSPPPSGPARPETPVSVKVSIGVLAALALLLLLNALLTFVVRDTVIDTLADAQPGSPRSDAERAVLLNLVQAVVFGVLAAVSAVFLARGRAWARWTGLAVSLPLGLLTLGATFLTGGVAASSLLVLVLCAAAATSLLARTTAAWASSGPRSRTSR
ncbi:MULTISPECIES: hypothetical protein [Modestobacter]|uniref:Uncharacterized protein n=1 Tax=Modestobacter caceresii TaxID=1522368 RepID=A0A098Y5F6_9ACTN|nr:MULTISPECIES: hypothetical protein [Modestobacter]KGH46118.1 hypothetical protein IN07_13550 [Modestobacter caceresii]